MLYCATMSLFLRAAKAINVVLTPFDLHLTRKHILKWYRDREARYRNLAISPVARERLLKLTPYLIPHRAVGHSKVRLGSEHDGGYVCLDDWKEISTVYSFGTANNDDWDYDVARKGIVVRQFDYTVDSGPHSHENLKFEMAKIVPTGLECAGEESITSLNKKYVQKKESAILKIDIEGDEWPVFESTPEKDLEVFAQIICEFHRWDRLDEEVWARRAEIVLKKLHEQFAVVHVHGNNIGEWIAVGGIAFPSELEITFANRLRYTLERSNEIFPTPLDAPTDENKPEFYLGTFTFSTPTS
jgi:hypothetical protein